ncbi:MAG: aldehyde ferredoxin oxidoreductase [Thermoprotei archaeon]|nr:MAG: aldehyde ferredoxin oxidoreductase [Thermoprotei archaeon]
MPHGFWGRLLEVDLTSGKSRVIDIDQKIYRMFIGGRGLATWLLWSRLGERWEEIDPLGPENMLLVLTGPLTGYYPGARVCISGKSPQSNGVIGSTLATEVAIELKAAGYDGIIVTGASKDPVYLYIEDDKVEIRDASRIWGKGSRETWKLIMEDTKPDHAKTGAITPPAFIYIGPAGENLVRTAVVMSKWSHAAGYGGYGAVMGSKKLKAIVVKGHNPLPRVSKPDQFKELFRKVVEQLLNRHGMRAWGTAQSLWSVGYDLSAEPIRNWQEEWHDVREFSQFELERRIWRRRYWSDWGCPTSCLKVSCVKKNGEVYFTDAPDYEMGAYLGSNLGVFNPEDVTYLTALADELGLCGIQTGNVIGFAFELYQRGILTKDDVGYELKWGDADAIARVLEDITYRKGIGKILAEGTYRAALAISKMKGVDVLKYAVQVKGVGVGAHGIRSGKDYPDLHAYASSVQGADHTSVAPEKDAVFYDSAVICWFNGVDWDTMIALLNAVTGWNATHEEIQNEIGVRVLTLQRILLLLGGPDVFWDPRIHDDNPPRFYEPLPSGPYKGKAADKREMEEKKREYYKELGWDELGIPLEETLEKLGIKKAVREVRRIKKRLGIST